MEPGSGLGLLGVRPTRLVRQGRMRRALEASVMLRPGRAPGALRVWRVPKLMMRRVAAVPGRVSAMRRVETLRGIRQSEAARSAMPQIAARTLRRPRGLKGLGLGSRSTIRRRFPPRALPPALANRGRRRVHPRLKGPMLAGRLFQVPRSSRRSSRLPA